jgi:uncharacterized membrane protein
MAAALMSLVGVFVAVYLYLYKLGQIGTIVCGTGGCETVQLSPWSEFMGVDVALIGVIGYVVMLGVAVAGLQPAAATRRWPARWLVVLSGGALLFSAYLTYLELFVIHAICRWCVVSALIVLGIFIAAVLDWRQATPLPATPSPRTYP